MANKHEFDFEMMDVYRVALGVARWFRDAEWPRATWHLKDNGLRAAESVVLNVAEGLARGGKAGKNHFRIGQGSAAEALAVLDLVELEGRRERQQELRRVGAMLENMRK